MAFIATSVRCLEKKSVAIVFGVAVACFLATLIFANSPAVAQQPTQPRQSQIETLAVVNGQTITRQQVASECLRRFGEDVLEDIVNKYLVQAELQKNGIAITEKDINDAITTEAKQFGMSGDRWLKLISSKRSMTADQIKNDYIWNKLALRRLVADQIQVSREELEERMEFEFGGKVQVRQIVLDGPQQAAEILASARTNPDNFERLAKQHSIDPNSKAIGGLLPPVRRNSGLPEFEKTAFSLQPGQISDIIQVADKYIILRCERIFPADELPPDQLAAVHDRLIDEVTNAKLADAAMQMFAQMQKTAQIQNVMNDPKLSQQMPGIAAIVNNTKVLKNQVAEECIVRYGKEMLETEINRKLLLQALERAGLRVQQEDIDAEIARAAESIGHLNQDGSVDVDRWLKFVTGNDLSKVDFYIEDEVWPTVATKKLVENSVSVTQEDMQKGFEANFGPRVEVLVVVANDHRQALKVWNMASANPSAEYFGQLANQYSVEPASKNNFGQVPPIQRHGGRAELEKEAFNLQTGEISKVVQVGEHWVIMYCQGRTEPVVTDFDAVKDELHKNILEKKMRLAMSDKFYQLKEEAQIDNFLAGTSQTGKAAVQSVRQANNRSGAAQAPVRGQR